MIQEVLKYVTAVITPLPPRLILVPLVNLSVARVDRCSKCGNLRSRPLAGVSSPASASPRAPWSASTPAVACARWRLSGRIPDYLQYSVVKTFKLALPKTQSCAKFLGQGTVGCAEVAVVGRVGSRGTLTHEKTVQSRQTLSEVKRGARNACGAQKHLRDSEPRHSAPSS